MNAHPHLTISQLKLHQLGPIDCTFQRGDWVSISGPSGAGKSLLLRAIADLDPHQGEVLLNGIPQQEISAPLWRQRVGYLPTESHWWQDEVGTHFPSVNEHYFKMLGFTSGVLDWQVDNCSSGERQRLALLRLLTNQPEILLLDEPTANLDRENTQRVEALLHNYQQQHNATLLWITHSPLQPANRHFHLDHGRLEELNQ